MEPVFELEVLGDTPARSGRLAAELEQALRFSAPHAQLGRRKTEADTMDVGTIIQVVVGSGAAIAIAHGVQTWLARRQTAQITVRKNGEVVARGITSADAVRLLEIFARRRGSKDT